MHSEKIFLVTFPAHIPILWDIQCFLWENQKFSLKKVLLFVNMGKGLVNLGYVMLS